MTRLRFNFLAGDTFARLEGVQALIEHAANSIPEMERQAQEALKDLAENEDWDFGDYSVEKYILESNYGHWVPKYAGYSSLVLLCSIVETQLLACAEHIVEDRNFAFRTREIKGSALESPVRVISALTSVNAAKDVAWPHLKDLQSLRNIIVHRGGVRGNTEQHQNEFDELLVRHPDRISKIHDMWSGDSLWIPMRTCQFFALEIRQFFKRLFENLGLPSKGVTHEP
jgi:hypothetical protein